MPFSHAKVQFNEFYMYLFPNKQPPQNIYLFN
jgi:hypothetical protein